MPVTETVHDSGRLAGVAELVVESPPVNAYSIGDLAELTELLRSYERREEVRAVVLRAQGKGFCGGGDVKEVQSLPGFDGILGQARGPRTPAWPLPSARFRSSAAYTATASAWGCCWPAPAMC